MAATAGVRVAQAVLLRDPYNDAVRSIPETRNIRGRDADAFSVALAASAGFEGPKTGFDIYFRPPMEGVEFTPRYVAGFHQYLTEEQISSTGSDSAAA